MGYMMAFDLQSHIINEDFTINKDRYHGIYKNCKNRGDSRREG